MIKYKGAYETGIGNVYCENCGAPMKNWEQIAALTTEKGQVYVFNCKKCKHQIKAYNSKG